MSKAFVKESDDEWLDQIPGTMTALISFLTRENNGIPVFERNTIVSEDGGKEVHEMSNGLSYALDDSGKWFVADL